MESRDLIISVAVLLLLLGAFTFLILKGRPKNTEGQSLGDIPTTQDLEEQKLSLSSRNVENQIQPKQDTNQEQTQTNNGTNPQRVQAPTTPQTPPREPPAMALDENIDYKAVIQTSMGSMQLDLYEEDAPITVNNFVSLAKEGFYNGLIFHRVMEDFMIQGGDPTGTGRGGPGYNFEDEINGIPLVEGSLAMANTGQPGTNGSQFFIVTRESTPWLNKKHTNFGMVAEGIDVAKEISLVQTNATYKPLKPVIIDRIEIIEEEK